MQNTCALTTMDKKNFQEILPLVEMPSRYLGTEINTVRKDLDQVDLKFALAFPDLYEIGTSYFGGQILYHVLNRIPDIAAERVFTPAPDMAGLMGKNGIPLLTLESGTPVAAFDILGISLLYELNFTNILLMLDLAGIPFYADERDTTYPLVVGGGPCAFNPEGVADFFDVILVGDGEKRAPDIAFTYMKWRREGDGKKHTLLNMLSEIEGVYVPAFFKAAFDKDGIQTTVPLKPGYSSVKRAVLSHFEDSHFPAAPVVPFGKPVHDRLRLEIARGCSKGCRFCQAGMIYRPVRERTCTELVKTAEKSLKTTGYRDISMLSLSTGDYSALEPLMKKLSGLNRHHPTALSLPSVRAEKLTPALMDIIRKVKKTGFTIAPEAGSQRLRNIINKKLSEEAIFTTVENAFNSGWRHIKLYFMIGLPFETDSDIEQICDLSRRLAALKSQKHTGIHVSVATFIPKSHTPFQRHPQISVTAALEKLQYLKDNLRHPAIKLKWQDPHMSLIEGVWARGDRRLSSLLVQAYENGCHLDGWSDRFRFDLWETAFEKAGIDPGFITGRDRPKTEPLPWDHIDSGISARFLEKEYDKARRGDITPDCRDSECSGCGTCDFSRIQPVLETSADTGGTEKPGSPAAPSGAAAFKKVLVFYAKLDQARHFGHLEFAQIMKRALRRAGIKVQYSKGFNPAMKLAFNNPLPVGMESCEEFFTLHVDASQNPAHLMRALNSTLPPGITVLKAMTAGQGKRPAASGESIYRIVLHHHTLPQDTIDDFMHLTEWVIEDISPKGKKRKTDLRGAVKKISRLDLNTLEMVMNNQQQQRIVRPSEILLKYFKVPENTVRLSKTTKIAQENCHA